MKNFQVIVPTSKCERRRQRRRCRTSIAIAHIFLLQQDYISPGASALN